MNLNKLDDLLASRGFDLDQSQPPSRRSEMRRSFQGMRNSQARKDILTGSQEAVPVSPRRQFTCKPVKELQFGQSFPVKNEDFRD